MGGKTTTQTSEPWKPSQAHLQTSLDDASRLYKEGIGAKPYLSSMVAPMSRQTIGGMDNWESVAKEAEPWMKSGTAQLDRIRDTRNPASIIGQQNMQAAVGGYGEPKTGQIDALARQSGTNPYASQFASLASRGPGANPAMAGMQSMSGPSGPSFSETNLAKIAQGGMLGGGDPYFEKALENASRKAQEQVSLSASGAGRYGSGMHQGNIAREVGELQTAARSNQYNTERDRQTQANQIIDAQRSGDFQNRLGALGSLANTYGQGVNQQLQSTLAGSDSRRSDLGQALQGYGMSADIMGRNADRRIGASSNLFNMGQQDIANKFGVFDRMNTAYDMALRPGQTMQDVGGRYDQQNQRMTDDRARIFDETQQAPWDQLARYNAIISGMGGLGRTERQQSNPGLMGVLGGLTSMFGAF